MKQNKFGYCVGDWEFKGEYDTRYEALEAAICEIKNLPEDTEIGNEFATVKYTFANLGDITDTSIISSFYTHLMSEYSGGRYQFFSGNESVDCEYAPLNESFVRIVMEGISQWQKENLLSVLDPDSVVFHRITDWLPYREGVVKFPYSWRKHR